MADTIKDLKDIQYLRMDIDYYKDKLKELEEGKSGIKSSSNSDITPGSHVTNPNNSSADVLIRIDELKEYIHKKEIELKETISRVNNKLDVLEPKEKIVIELHYINGETIEYICGVVNYSYRHTNRLHKSALRKLKTCPKMS